VYVDQARTGDHVCYISDTRKLEADYPGWTAATPLRAIVDEIIGAWRSRLAHNAARAARGRPAVGRRAAKQLGVPGCIVFCGAGYGDRLNCEFAGRVSVEVKEHEPASVTALGSCGALYLNYPFGRWSRVFRENVVPDELSTYVYAARPPLIHAPPSTSTGGLPADFPGYAAAWETTSLADGASALVKLLADGTSRHTAAEAVRRRYYDPVAHRATLAGVLARFTGAAEPSE
jgi:hypothetical protein